MYIGNLSYSTVGPFQRSCHKWSNYCCGAGYFTRFDKLQSLGKMVASTASSQANELAIADRMGKLTSIGAILRELWEKRSHLLQQCHELQLFLHEAQQVDSATTAREVFLSNDDLGVSPNECCWIYMTIKIIFLLFVL